MANTYYPDETFEITGRIKDTDGKAATPATSIVVRIMDSAGVRKVTDEAMSVEEKGFYYYRHTLPSDAAVGTWTYEAIATDTGAAVSIGAGSFTVAARTA